MGWVAAIQLQPETANPEICEELLSGISSNANVYS